MAQFFCGQDTLVYDAYGIKSTKQFINTLADMIRNRGAMHTLISDGGSYEICKKVTDLLRSLFIADYQSEPYNQHQTKAENQWGTAKRWVNKIMIHLAALHQPGFSASNMSVSSSTTCPLCPGWPPSPPGPDRTDSRHLFPASFFFLGTCLLQS